jgi:DNA polymerase V
VQKIPKLKRNVASTRSFGQDIDSFDQVAEAMYSYIKSGVKKLIDNEISPNRATIFLAGNIHKGQKHYTSRQVTLQRQTRSVDEIWSQIFPHLRSMFSATKKYKKCGIIFNDLMPESIQQGSLFSSSYQTIQPPSNVEKKWEMRQEYISQKFTTSWDEIPAVFV